jgi:hypothetical protein
MAASAASCCPCSRVGHRGVDACAQPGGPSRRTESTLSVFQTPSREWWTLATHHSGPYTGPLPRPAGDGRRCILELGRIAVIQGKTMKCWSEASSLSSGFGACVPWIASDRRDTSGRHPPAARSGAAAPQGDTITAPGFWSTVVTSPASSRVVPSSAATITCQWSRDRRYLRSPLRAAICPPQRGGVEHLRCPAAVSRWGALASGHSALALSRRREWSLVFGGGWGGSPRSSSSRNRQCSGTDPHWRSLPVPGYCARARFSGPTRRRRFC